jgi:hypothetical protein
LESDNVGTISADEKDRGRKTGDSHMDILEGTCNVRLGPFRGEITGHLTFMQIIWFLRWFILFLNEGFRNFPIHEILISGI